jgi:hypothetical protein
MLKTLKVLHDTKNFLGEEGGIQHEYASVGLPLKNGIVKEGDVSR